MSAGDVGVSGGDKFVKSENPCGMSDNTCGYSFLLFAGFIASINTIMIDVAEDDGVSANAITLYAACFTLGCSTMIDGYYWYVGYGDGQHVSGTRKIKHYIFNQLNIIITLIIYKYIRHINT